MATPAKRPEFEEDFPDELDVARVAETIGAAVTSSVADGVREAVAGRVGVAEGGIGVSVAGGVTCNSNFCPGTMMELALRPFHLINSTRSTL
jgi:hypothetical protein